MTKTIYSLARIQSWTISGKRSSKAANTDILCSLESSCGHALSHAPTTFLARMYVHAGLHAKAVEWACPVLAPVIVGLYACVRRMWALRNLRQDVLPAFRKLGDSIEEAPRDLLQNAFTGVEHPALGCCRLRPGRGVTMRLQPRLAI